MKPFSSVLNAQRQHVDEKMRKVLCVPILMTVLLTMVLTYLLIPAKSETEIPKWEAKGSMYVRREDYEVMLYIIVSYSLEARGHIYLTAKDSGRNITITVP